MTDSKDNHASARSYTGSAQPQALLADLLEARWDQSGLISRRGRSVLISSEDLRHIAAALRSAPAQPASAEPAAWLYDMAHYIKPADEEPLRDWRRVVTIDPPPTIPKDGVRNVVPLYPLDLSDAGPTVGYCAWQPIETSPAVKVGSEREFIVAVYRASSGKVYTFACTYLNAYRLQYEECQKDPDKSGFCNDCEDGCPTTGWFYLTGDSDNESGCYQSLSLAPDDKLLGWREMPKWDGLSAIPSTDLAQGQSELSRPDRAVGGE